jgi:hypothetical protein
LAHRGFPAAVAGTRLRFPQFGHVTMSVFMALPPSGRQGRFRRAHDEFAVLDGDADLSTARDLAA